MNPISRRWDFLITLLAAGQTIFMQNLLEKIVQKNRSLTENGRPVKYIPALSKMPASILGVTVKTANGDVYSAGDWETLFTMQSVSKPVALMLALMDRGREYVFSRVGTEPSADRFDSITRLETMEPSKPLNPMINAGAIAVTSMIKGRDREEKFARLLSLVRHLAGNNEIEYNPEVYYSEKGTGDRNRSLAYYMRSAGVIEGDVEEILDLYFRQCAIEVTCRDLANIGLCLARDGAVPGNPKLNLPGWVFRLVKTFMVTCGMYDESGYFAINAGFPAKSGVSGAIMGSIPARMGVGVIGPALNDKGNSVAGMQLLADLSGELQLSIF